MLMNQIAGARGEDLQNSWFQAKSFRKLLFQVGVWVRMGLARDE